MNPHYHPYGAGPDLTSPHPPSPDNYSSSHGPHSHMLSSNGHGIGLLGHPGRPHNQLMHQHHQHPAFNNGGGPPSGHHQHINNNNNNGTVKICSGCGEKIIERFLLHALDGYWHNSCLKCSVCHAMLADMGSSCFTRDNMILCKDDYGRMFGSGACSACGQKIPASEYVMRSGLPSPASSHQGGQRGGQPGGGVPTHHVFHLKCFTCSKCGVQLMPGDRYYMLAGSLVCEQDWHKLLKSSAAAPTVRKGKVGRPRRSRD